MVLCYAYRPEIEAIWSNLLQVDTARCDKVVMHTANSQQFNITRIKSSGKDASTSSTAAVAVTTTATQNPAATGDTGIADPQTAEQVMSVSKYIEIWYVGTSLCITRSGIYDRISASSLLCYLPYAILLLCVTQILKLLSKHTD